MGGKRGTGETAERASQQLSLQTGRPRVLAAEVHGFRHPKSTWPALLERVRELGVTHVTTLVPWSEVEPRPSEIELGERRPSMAIGEFLDHVATAGLRAIVRIGPRIRADLALAGIPDHVVHDRASMARSARGNPVPSPIPPRMFPWPSYASTAYRAHVRRFVSSIAGELVPRLAPTGIVDAIDIEDPSAVLVRAGAYARDYHPDAVASFRSFVEHRYGSISELSAAWGINETSFSELTPPTRFSAETPRDLPRHLDWAAFQEWLVDDFRGFLRNALVDAGFSSVSLSSALDASAIGVPTDASNASSRLDRVGVELATRATELVAIRRRLSSVAIASMRPFARILLGGSPWGRPRREHDAIASALLAVAFGARELELSMGVSHERWWGAPIDMDGSTTSSFESVRALVAALTELGLERLTTRHDVVIVIPPEYVRFVRVTHLFGPLGAGLLDFAGRSFAEATLDSKFGFERAIQHAFLDRLGALEAALDEARVDFSFLDPESVRSLDVVPKLAFAPTFEMLDESTTAALDELARRGAQVVIGPDRPRLGHSMDPVNAGLQTATVLGDLAHSDLVRSIVEIASSTSIAPAPHDAASGARAFALHAHDTKATKDTRGAIAGYVLANAGDTVGGIHLDDASTWTDPLSGETFPPGERIPVIARSARLVVVRSPERRAEKRSEARR